MKKAKNNMNLAKQYEKIALSSPPSIHETKSKEEIAESELKSKRNAEPLKCDVCGITMGYVDADDLNGSYFYCEDCIKNND